MSDSTSTQSFGVAAYEAMKKDGFGLNKAARLDNQRYPEQYSPRFELQLNPSFPYRLEPFNPKEIVRISSDLLEPP
jgi:hypothetical protein